MNNTLVVIGVIILALGILAGVYQVTVDEGPLQGEELEKPYSNFMIPLVIGGIIVILIGAFVPTADRRKNG